MHDRCPGCGLHFNREPGYFLGAMYISYGLGLAVIFIFGAAIGSAKLYQRCGLCDGARPALPGRQDSARAIVPAG